MDPRPDLPARHGIDELIECLAGDSQCPLCGAPFSPDGLRASQTDAGRWVLSIHCGCCNTGSLIAVDVPHLMLGSASPAAETSPDASSAALRCKATSPLSADDVLDMHIFLSHFHGDLSSLVLASRAARRS